VPSSEKPRPGAGEEGGKKSEQIKKDNSLETGIRKKKNETELTGGRGPRQWALDEKPEKREKGWTTEGKGGRGPPKKGTSHQTKKREEGKGSNAHDFRA